MLIVLCCLFFLALGVAGLVALPKCKISYKLRDRLFTPIIVVFLLGLFSSAGCGTLILMNTIGYDLDYQTKLHEKEVLEYRLEHLYDNIVGNETIYSDIVAFNNDLLAEKTWANNCWTSWFNNKDIASIDYIKLPID